MTIKVIVRVIDMQDLEYIIDLDHYKDLTHYDLYIQELMVDAIVSGEFDATPENIDEKIGRMLRFVEAFEEENLAVLGELR